MSSNSPSRILGEIGSSPPPLPRPPDPSAARHEQGAAAAGHAHPAPAHGGMGPAGNFQFFPFGYANMGEMGGVAGFQISTEYGERGMQVRLVPRTKRTTHSKWMSAVAQHTPRTKKHISVPSNVSCCATQASPLTSGSPPAHSRPPSFNLHAPASFSASFFARATLHISLGATPFPPAPAPLHPVVRNGPTNSAWPPHFTTKPHAQSRSGSL